MRILVVEDNLDLAGAIADRLRSEGHVVDIEHDGEEATCLLRRACFDLVVLDVNLPGRSGFDILRSLRADNNSVAVLVLTARSLIEDKLLGIDAGADDFMVKPFDYRELVARCRMLGRRRAGSASNTFTAENLVFDRRAKRARVDGRDIDLKAKEVQLLEIFLDHIGSLLSKEEVADKLYSYSEAPSLNAVEQHVTRLRKKLEGTPVAIKTVRGLGYLSYVEE